MALLSGAVHFDLLVSDVGLPGPMVAGWPFTLIQLRLHQGHPRGRLCRAGRHEPAVSGGRMELLVKPFDAQALVNKVHAVMGLGPAQ